MNNIEKSALVFIQQKTFKHKAAKGLLLCNIILWTHNMFMMRNETQWFMFCVFIMGLSCIFYYAID